MVPGITHAAKRERPRPWERHIDGKTICGGHFPMIKIDCSRSDACGCNYLKNLFRYGCVEGRQSRIPFANVEEDTHGDHRQNSCGCSCWRSRKQLFSAASVLHWGRCHHVVVDFGTKVAPEKMTGRTRWGGRNNRWGRRQRNYNCRWLASMR